MNTQQSWYTDGTKLCVKFEAAAGIAVVPPDKVQISMSPSGQFTVTFFPPRNTRISKLVLRGEIAELAYYNNRYNKVTKVTVWYGGIALHLDVSQKKFLMPVQNS